MATQSCDNLAFRCCTLNFVSRLFGYRDFYRLYRWKARRFVDIKIVFFFLKILAIMEFFLIFVLIQFNVPFKIISLISRQIGRWGRNGGTPGKPLDTRESRTWLVSHVASAGLKPTPVTAVR